MNILVVNCDMQNSLVQDTHCIAPPHTKPVLSLHNLGDAFIEVRNHTV